MEKLKALYGGGDEGAVLVTPDNWPAVQVFLTQENRWRRTPAGKREGLDFAQVESTVRLMRMKRKAWQAMFWKLLTMEKAALEEMAR